MSELKPITSVFNIEIEKIDPNPDQPRKHFNDESLRDLSESIRRYGVMQPITVFRRESETSDGGISTRYEIIAGERRWRASILAGMNSIPAIIHEEEASEQERYELSILENLQREDLNPVDKAHSFERLANEFGMKHAEIADKLGKSREYVTNAMRLLVLPENILDALSNGYISEGHTRPLLSLKEKPDELQVLFTEITTKGLNVREAEKVGRELSKGSSASRNQIKAQAALDPEMQELQKQLADSLGTSVSIDKKEQGGKLTIDFFSRDDLKKLLAIVGTGGMAGINGDTAEATDKGIPTSEIHQTSVPQEPVAPVTQPTVSDIPQTIVPSNEPQTPQAQVPTPETDDFFKPNALHVTDDVALKETINESAVAQAEVSHDPIVGAVSSGISDRQKEIDALAMQSKENEYSHAGNVSKPVDLGDINPTNSTYAQDAVTPSGITTFQGEINREVQFGEQTPFKTTDADGNQLDKRYPGTASEGVFANSDNFVPNGDVPQSQAEVSIAGSDFIPTPPTIGNGSALDKAMNSIDDPFAPDNPVMGSNPDNASMNPIGSEAEITMGGLSAGFSDKDDDANDPYNLNKFSV